MGAGGGFGGCGFGLGGGGGGLGLGGGGGGGLGLGGGGGGLGLGGGGGGGLPRCDCGLLEFSPDGSLSCICLSTPLLLSSASFNQSVSCFSIDILSSISNSSIMLRRLIASNSSLLDSSRCCW